ncbi:class I SAM-dependent methyltransferase [Halovenus halobia]|uniref:class I SAM-dependent methyltransferase n=1 Tax=Halovenus halobia TaxID=3396622 RepID=UPI003F573198
MLIYRRVERLADSNDLIVDIGTKDGKHLRNIPGTTIGVDLELNYPLQSERTSYIHADGRRLPFQDDSVDYVIMNQVLEHVDGRQSLLREVARVLKPDGVSLVSFPNRLGLNRPHGLPRWLSMAPKSLGVHVARRLLSSEQYDYYRKFIFPLSPVGARKLLSEQFHRVEYITVDESSCSTDIYGDSLGSRLFVFSLPLIARLSELRRFERAFEALWPYVGYECTLPASETTAR